MRWHIIAALLACALPLSSAINGARKLSSAEQADSHETSGAGSQETSVNTSPGGVAKIFY